MADYFDRSLVAGLSGVVDSARGIAGSLGARPYRITLVWTRWSGGERGVGVEVIEREETLSPTPKIYDLSGVRRELLSVGLEEAGSLQVTEISARYMEDFLLGRGPAGEPLDDNQTFYWEVWFPERSGVRRRFYPFGTPSFVPTSVQWKVTLTKVSDDRSRAGDPSP